MYPCLTYNSTSRHVQEAICELYFNYIHIIYIELYSVYIYAGIFLQIIGLIV